MNGREMKKLLELNGFRVRAAYKTGRYGQSAIVFLSTKYCADDNARAHKILTAAGSINLKVTGVKSS